MINSTEMAAVHGSPPNGHCCPGEGQGDCRWREPGEPRLKDSSVSKAQLPGNALQPVPCESLQNNIPPAGPTLCHLQGIVAQSVSIACLSAVLLLYVQLY